MKYKDTMTAPELSGMLSELRKLDEMYASMKEKQGKPLPPGWCDEQEELRRAALNRGRP